MLAAIAIRPASHDISKKYIFTNNTQHSTAKRNGKSCVRGQNLTQVQDADSGTKDAIFYYT